MFRFIGNSSGKNRKLLELSLCDLTDQQKKSLVGMHAFTGSDYVTNFAKRNSYAGDLSVMIKHSYFAIRNSYAGDLSVMIKHSWIYLVRLARKYT